MLMRHPSSAGVVSNGEEKVMEAMTELSGEGVRAEIKEDVLTSLGIVYVI